MMPSMLAWNAAFKKALPDCDMISYGPNIYDVHSTKEHLEIDSVARVWAFTKALLASMR